jgi:hypothetical protein
MCNYERKLCYDQASGRSTYVLMSGFNILGLITWLVAYYLAHFAI